MVWLLLVKASESHTFFNRRKKPPRTLAAVSSALATNSPPDCSLNASRPQRFKIRIIIRSMSGGSSRATRSGWRGRTGTARSILNYNAYFPFSTVIPRDKVITRIRVMTLSRGIPDNRGILILIVKGANCRHLENCTKLLNVSENLFSNFFIFFFWKWDWQTGGNAVK